MSTPDQRARDKDRDAAIEVVEAAWSDGRIVEADRDKRIEELRRAQTLGEVQMLVHDLQSTPAPGPGPEPGPEAGPEPGHAAGAVVPAAYLAPTGYREYQPGGSSPAADPTPDPEAAEAAGTEAGSEVPPATWLPDTPAQPPPHVPYGSPMPTPAPTASSARVSKRLLLVPLVGVVVVAVLAIGGITAIVNAIRDNTTSGVLGALDHQDANVISVQGYTDLLDAVREQSGSTTAFSAVLYPTYAVVELPVDHRTAHEEYWYWDGSELTSNDIKSSSSFPRTDLASVDPQVVVDLVRKVRSKMPDEDTWYAIVRAPDESGAAVWAYASNDFGDTVYLGARPDGRITWDSTEH
ncbi:DUF1707 domain-containing protein [Nocardioides sp.]|uniref:DUF1707 SHOCT-like domain-containing protein n=1 Tax=Nocardioides sp. TaxID=35761 RepID=UPI003784CD1A